MSEEVVLLVVGSLALVLLFAPFVGIQRAIKRRRLKLRSTGAVMLSGAGTLAAIVLALAQLTPLYAIGLVLVNLTWLGFALRTNHEGSRR